MHIRCLLQDHREIDSLVVIDRVHVHSVATLIHSVMKPKLIELVIDRRDFASCSNPMAIAFSGTRSLMVLQKKTPTYTEQSLGHDLMHQDQRRRSIRSREINPELTRDLTNRTRRGSFTNVRLKRVRAFPLRAEAISAVPYTQMRIPVQFCVFCIGNKEKNW
ncbi:hypothetical protein NL676_007481 [Syzygium grande]|nr:hypothetical protein NL676_007481 [Syzygium grande]